jgi:hypothetical protein
MTPQEVRHQHSIKVRIKDFAIPPIHDALVLGKNSPIGCAAIRKAIDLLVHSPFEHIELDDEVISDILVRNKILRRIPRNKLVAFVLKRIKPLMGAEEILHLDLDAEVTLEDEIL